MDGKVNGRMKERIDGGLEGKEDRVMGSRMDGWKNG